MMNRIRGVILPVVLFILLLVGLLGAMFSFRVHADYSSTQAIAYRYQTRLAAEAGIERVKLLLRDHQLIQEMWYHNPDEMHRIVVWGHNIDHSVIGTNEELDDPVAYRFSIVADDTTDDEDYIRIGIIDESSKLNLNTATQEQLLIMVRSVIDDEEEINPQLIVDAIIDWRDRDSKPNGEQPDTEGEYYKNLSKPYLIKNKPFDTVEELLLVKGVTGQLLYGEDYDRNGLLNPNEGDGDQSFPPDNGDDQLNRGLYPYLTVTSYENNVDNENHNRIYLFGPQQQVREQLEEMFEGDTQIVDHIITAIAVSRSSRRGNNNNQPNNNNQSQNNPENNNPLDGNVPTSDQNDGSNPEENPEENAGQGQENENNQNNSNNSQESNQPQTTTRKIETPASLMRMRSPGGELVPSPIPLEKLAILMDRTTTLPPKQRRIDGLINVNTAPSQVLQCIPGITEEQVASIVDIRQSVGTDDMFTSAWLVFNEALDMDTYEKIAPYITARGQQFMIESLGYADHIGMVTRLQVIVDIAGPIAQTIYYRDLTRLGGHYPIREEDRENIRVR